jgi:hypothetical protein
VNTQQAMSLLRRRFPEFEDLSAETTQLCGHSSGRSIDIYDFAMFVTELRERLEDAQLGSAFAMVEQFLVDGSAEVREWASAWLEAVQNIASWRRYGLGAFVPCLGRESRALWDVLETIRRQSFELDLADCSVLEAEILTWRFARGKAQALTAIA